MDIDEPPHDVSFNLLVLQETQIISEKQTRIVEQQDILTLGQKELQLNLLKLHSLSSSPRRRKPTSSTPHTNDADSEEDESSDEGQKKEKLPSRYHVK